MEEKKGIKVAYRKQSKKSQEDFRVWRISDRKNVCVGMDMKERDYVCERDRSKEGRKIYVFISGKLLALCI